MVDLDAVESGLYWYFFAGFSLLVVAEGVVVLSPVMMLLWLVVK